MSTSPAALAAALIEQSRRAMCPEYACVSCGHTTTSPSVTDASDYYPTSDGALEFQHRHYLCCPRCYATNLEKRS
jgi:hypothetical protein